MPRLIPVVLALCLLCFAASAHAEPYAIVDTGQSRCYDDSGPMPCPAEGQDFHGQDAQYLGNAPMYKDNGDGTVSDLNTGLMWVKKRGEKMYWQDAEESARGCRVGGYDDWRMPTIKELYSLIDFRGSMSPGAQGVALWLDSRFFDFAYGDTAQGERSIDCQDWSATRYVGTTMNGEPTAFGVNFADGRIKGYPMSAGNARNKRFVRYVRGNQGYGRNDFIAKGDGTVVDGATSLVWQQADSGAPMDWESALAYCENLDLAGLRDWRLPNAKELQSIVDYSRSPTATGSAAIAPVFSVTDIESYFWTSTTHLEGRSPGSNAVYVAFGRAMGYFAPPGSPGQKRYIDVHGAGAQRSDPKSGTPSAFAQGHGPQGDDRRINNYVRCVRGGAATPVPPGGEGTDAPPWGYSEGVELEQQPGRSSGMGRTQRLQPLQGPQSPGPRTRQGPPPEAMAACSGKSQGQGCSFQAPHGNVAGVCRAIGQDLACAPDGAPPPHAGRSAN